MATLALPPPVNDYGSGDTLLAASGAGGSGLNGNGVNGAGEGDEGGKKSEQLLKGIIYPSREIRGIIDKTAVHIAKSPSPQLLEDRIREHQKADPKFSFLRDSDPFNRYYRYMIEKVKEEGEESALASSTGAAAGAKTAGPGAAEGEGDEEKVVETEVERKKREMQLRQGKVTGPLEEPRGFEFSVDLPNVTAVDLDILRLTALFTARRGRRFLESLSIREGRNFQFDFLRPSHSLYGYFNRMVEQYTKILHPPAELLDRLKKGSEDKWATLEECRKRSDWEKARKDKEAKKKEEQDAEAKAFAEIDWQDFAVVQNIEFTSADQTIDLPPPTSMEALRMMGLNEKRMAAMIVEETGQDRLGQDVGAGGDDDGDEMEVEMDEESGDEETREQKRKEAEELARAREIQAKAMSQAGMKIRKDYQPKGLAGRQAAKSKVPMSVCPYCKENIPETEISEHIRIELLDPRWREQKELLDRKKTQQALLTQNADIAGSLRQLASARTDLFGTAEEEDERKKREDEERAARRAKEAIIWDGHTASKASTLDTFQKSFNLDEQIAAIHRRNQLLPNNQANSIGPQMGVSAQADISPAQAAGASTPGGGTAFTGAVISAGPSAPSAPTPQQQYGNPYGNFVPLPDQPMFDPSMFNQPPMPNQQQFGGSPNPYGNQEEQGEIIDVPLPAAPAGLPAKPVGAGMGMHPSRMAALGGASPGYNAPGSPMGNMGSPVPQVAGVVRPYEGGDSPAEGHVAKRARVEKVAGHFYSEADWINMHPNPITISIQLPTMPEKPEWKLNGSIINVPDLPLNFLVSTLRDKVMAIIDAPLPLSRIRFDYGTKILSNTNTLASVNIDDGDTIQLSIRKK